MDIVYTLELYRRQRWRLSVGRAYCRPKRGGLWNDLYRCTFGPGVVFKLAPTAVAGQTPWIETTLWNFNGSDGALPLSTLVADQKGTLYGTTQFGGNPSCAGGFGCGVVFELTGTGFATNNGG